MADGEHGHEIFIIKRHGAHEDVHHGGVWKIAFADFMTAMMAFFLVMWLISANDKTKATIASYFNPVKLVDTTTQPKGLEDAKPAESASPSKATKSAAKETPTKEPAKETPTKELHDKEKPLPESKALRAGSEDTPAVKNEKRLATAVLDDPYAALTEIAGSKGAGEHAAAPPASIVKSAVNAISRKGGEAFRDPFAPPPPLQSEAKNPPGDLGAEDAKLPPGGGDPTLAGPLTGKALSGAGGGEAAEASPAKALAHADAGDTPSGLKAQLLAAVKGAESDKGPQIEVRKSDGGLLISLNDAADFEMFSSGSIVPSRKVVLMMDRIAQVLKTKPGAIVLRGYTDGRPYKGARYDNWRLSLDRAQVMHSMLVRGGLDEGRLAHIEGYADRNLKSPGDPASPVNRRIEILLKEATP